jgi:hypothetical protein
MCAGMGPAEGSVFHVRVSLVMEFVIFVGRWSYGIELKIV